MNRIFELTIVTCLGICVCSGCGKSSTSETAKSPSGGAATNAGIDPATNEVAKAAADFLDAVLKGDTQRASARLTPAAMQRIIASGIPFSPPGLESASFQISQVRTPSQDQAIVQCVLTDKSDPKNPHNEEMCCLLRRVENDWRVSGIAYGTTPDKPWTLSDFETGQNSAISRQPANQTQQGNMAAGGQAAGRPSPRTAQEAAPPTQR